MHTQRIVAVVANVALLSSIHTGAIAQDRFTAEAAKVETPSTARPVLWREPADIESRNLLYGAGGEQGAPHPPFTFEKEDMEGTNPKFDVRDQSGVKWKVKLGAEARPETVAARLLWAIGYYTTDDYTLADFRVQGMPSHLKRGEKFVEADGSMHDARLKKNSDGEKKTGEWEWRNNPFNGTRELNGLRVMMAVINNWDLKDVNNAVYEKKKSGDGEGPELVYLVSDLGASFGTTNYHVSHEKAKGNLDSYIKSKFIRKIDGEFVDFEDPHRPVLVGVANPFDFMSRVNMEWIGRHVPRADARWVGQLLARLSAEQIRDAFRAGQFPPDEVEGYARVLEYRIAELNKL